MTRSLTRRCSGTGGGSTTPCRRQPWSVLAGAGCVLRCTLSNCTRCSPLDHRMGIAGNGCEPARTSSSACDVVLLSYRTSATMSLVRPRTRMTMPTTTTPTKARGGSFSSCRGVLVPGPHENWRCTDCRTSPSQLLRPGRLYACLTCASQMGGGRVPRPCGKAKGWHREAMDPTIAWQRVTTRWAALIPHGAACAVAGACRPGR